MDDYNVGHAVADAGAGIGRALMQVMAIGEERRNRAYELARQGNLDAQAARRLDLDEERLTLEAQRTDAALKTGAQRRTYEVMDRMNSDLEAGWSSPRDLGSITYPAMFRVGAPQTMPGAWDLATGTAEPVSVAGALTQVGSPRTVAPTYDPTKSIEYRNREAQLDQNNRMAVNRAKLLAELEGPKTFIMFGREFYDNPEGWEKALVWRHEVMGDEEGTNMFSDIDPLPPGTAEPEGEGNWLTSPDRWWNNLGRGEAAAEQRLIADDVALNYTHGKMRKTPQQRTEELLTRGITDREQIRAILQREGFLSGP